MNHDYSRINKIIRSYEQRLLDCVKKSIKRTFQFKLMILLKKMDQQKIYSLQGRNSYGRGRYYYGERENNKIIK